jgi:hypothetical protein
MRANLLLTWELLAHVLIGLQADLTPNHAGSLNHGPPGCFSPPFHFRTLDRLVFNTAASAS